MPFTPFASDTLGRRSALFIGSLIMLAGVALQCSALSVAMFIGARFVSEYSKIHRNFNPSSLMEFMNLSSILDCLRFLRYFL